MSKFKVSYGGDNFIIKADRIFTHDTGVLILQDGATNTVAVFPTGAVAYKIDSLVEE